VENNTLGESIILPHEALFCFIWEPFFYIFNNVAQYQPIDVIKCRKMQSYQKYAFGKESLKVMIYQSAAVCEF